MIRKLFLAAALLAALPVASQERSSFVRDLVSRTDSAAAQALPDGQRQKGMARARIDHALLRELLPGHRFGFTPPDKEQARFVVERVVEHANGDRTVVGKLDAAGEARRAVITTGAAGSVGRIDTADGRFELHAEDGAAEIRDRRAQDRRVPEPVRNDARRPPPQQATSARAQAESSDTTGSASAPVAAALIPSGNSVIDLLVLTSPGMATRYAGSLLQTRVNNLVEIGNQAYINSQIRITLRVVKTQQVSYGDTQTLDTALTELTNGSGALSGVAALRSQYGADMVTLMRPYDGRVDEGCGIAWILSYAAPISFNRAHAVSIVSDGDDMQSGSPFYCPDTTLVHEIGHNLGSAHDRAHSLDTDGSLISGTFPYSFGHGAEGVFGTIMSYLDPLVDLFSNPRIQCNGQPCGIAGGASGQADNATSMNNTRATAASFMASVAPISSGLNDLLIDFGAQAGLWLKQNDSVWVQVHTLSPPLMEAGDLDNNGRSDVLIDFGTPHGIWIRRNGSSWTQLHTLPAQQMVASDLDNDGHSDFVINFGSPHGVWVWRNDTSWAQLHGLAPSQIVSATLDADARRDLIVDFGAPHGIWQYMNDTNWVKLHDTTVEDIVVGDMDGNGVDDIIIDVGSPHGIWVRMNQASWVQLHGLSAQHMAVGNFAGDARKDVVIDFGAPHGIWLRQDNTSWVQVHGLSAETLAVADLDRNGIDDLIVDFGAQHGLWAWKNASSWVQQHTLSPRNVIAIDSDAQ